MEVHISVCTKQTNINFKKTIRRGSMIRGYTPSTGNQQGIRNYSTLLNTWIRLYKLIRGAR